MITANQSESSSFAKQLKIIGRLPLRADAPEILQLNLGRRCNLACKHCHVNAGPNRTEEMSRETMESCVKVAAENHFTTVDITGGAPEMNSNLDWLLNELSKLERRIIVRSNLSILNETGYEEFISHYSRSGVELVGSLPDLNQARTDRQRGNESFTKIIAVMQQLNRQGYGKSDSELKLHLVHNPVGAYLSGSQEALEMEYRRRLQEEHGVVFNQLFTINNLPVGRYLNYLEKSENLEDYLNDLKEAFNPATVDKVMCKNTISVGWNGQIFDCDFNQVLELPVRCESASTISNFSYEKLAGREIVLGDHCFGCTAGAGSSCQGETV